MPTALLDLSVLATNSRTRGIGRYVADLAVGLGRLTAQNSDIRVLGLERLSWVGRADVTEDLEGAVRRLTDRAQPIRAHTSWAYRVRVGLAAAARAISPDLVHIGHPNATPLGELGCPRLVTCHDLIPLHYPNHYLNWKDGFLLGRGRLDFRRYHSADHVIAVSETTANDLVTLLGVPAKNITVVYNGVDLARWSSEPGESDSEVRKRYGLEESSYVLCVGAADWRKNHDGMLEALSNVRKRVPDSDVLLVWAARLELATQLELKRKAWSLGVGDFLRLLGYVSDEELAALYRGAVAQLFPSRAEGFGYPVVEAMATGCPVITSDRSSLAEIAGDAALTVDPESSEAIADAILRLVDDNEERRRLSRLGTARAGKFSLDRMAYGTLEVYREMIRHGRGGA